MQRASKVYNKTGKGQEKELGFFLPFHDEKQKRNLDDKECCQSPKDSLWQTGEGICL